MTLLSSTSRAADPNSGKAIPFDTPGASNPIVPGYFADPTIKKFGDTYFLYSTTDGNGGGRAPSQVWVSDDFVDWTLVPMNWPLAGEAYWAPEVVKRGEKYYLYFSQPCVIYGGVADSPIGPWTPLNENRGEVIPNFLVDKVITLDAQAFEDKDGSTFVHWGTWGIYPGHGCGVGKLGADMKTITDQKMIPNTQVKDFFEAPFMFEHNGIYYLTYSSGSCHDSTYRVQYATSDRPDGEFKMGRNNPILSTTPDGTVDGPGHHSLLEHDNKYIMVYHRHDIPRTPNGLLRQLCADHMEIDTDGSIEKVVPTHEGIGALATKIETSPNLAFTRAVKADSFYRDTLRNHEYKPEYAVDDNNATLWRPADNKMGHTLSIDLGSVQPVRRIATQFEYATWYYQYLIETSMDEEKWEVFADRRENTRWGSPMIDRNDVNARYVRLTITGVQKPGIFGAIWNIKVYAEDRVGAYEKLADEGFHNFVSSQSIDDPGQAYRRTSTNSTEPLISVTAEGLAPDSETLKLANSGSLQGYFAPKRKAPVVKTIEGRSAIYFSGEDVLEASFSGPPELSGNSSYTVEAMVFNPEVAEAEALISWCGRGGPDGMTGQVGYGSHPSWGAVGHWGFADMGFAGKTPQAGQWHHIAVVFDGVIERVYVDGALCNQAAKMLLMHAGRPIYLGASEPGVEHYSGYLAWLKVWPYPRPAESFVAP
jgi:hypothetical protein